LFLILPEIPQVIIILLLLLSLFLYASIFLGLPLGNTELQAVAGETTALRA
jgi:hypothetical protein